MSIVPRRHEHGPESHELHGVGVPDALLPDLLHRRHLCGTLSSPGTQTITCSSNLSQHTSTEGALASIPAFEPLKVSAADLLTWCCVQIIPWLSYSVPGVLNLGVLTIDTGIALACYLLCVFTDPGR